jgi:secreted trypsin-like serine protease
LIPKINSIFFSGDLAIAILKETIQFTDYIIPVCLTSQSFPLSGQVGKNGTVTGWGTLENRQGLATEAREVAIPVVDSVTCLASGFSFYYIFSEDSSFCAGKRDGRGPCKGDSGSGFYMRRDGKWYLVGIVSASLFAENTCDLNNYVVFTDISKFELWILNNIVGA